MGVDLGNGGTSQGNACLAGHESLLKTAVMPSELSPHRPGFRKCVRSHVAFTGSDTSVLNQHTFAYIGL
jgi:hypothetical protein